MFHKKGDKLAYSPFLWNLLPGYAIIVAIITGTSPEATVFPVKPDGSEGTRSFVPKLHGIATL
jgi:hypothetical protein